MEKRLVRAGIWALMLFGLCTFGVVGCGNGGGKPPEDVAAQEAERDKAIFEDPAGKGGPGSAEATADQPQ